MNRVPKPYDDLKVDCLEDWAPIEASAAWTITDSPKESICITTAMMPDGHFVYGYIVNWGRGGSSAVLPSAERGLFHTQREAKLHCLGFMKAYLSYFLPDTQRSLVDAESSLLQGSLFE